MRNKIEKTILLFIFLSGFWLVGAQSVEAATLARPANNLGLVGYWSFNEGTTTKAHDFSGSGNVGILSSSVMWANGRYGRAISFDGVDDSITFGSQTVTANTISFWFNTAAGEDGPLLYSGTDSYDSSAWNWGIWTDATNLNFAATAGAVQVTSPVVVNSWTQYVMVRNDDGDMKVYANGVLVNSATGGTDNGALSAIEAGDYYAKGSLDDVRIYNRALSAAEISTLYQSASAVKINSSTNSFMSNGLVGLWSMDGQDVSSTVTITEGGGGDIETGPVTSVYLDPSEDVAYDLASPPTNAYCANTAVWQTDVGMYRTMYHGTRQPSAPGCESDMDVYGNWSDYETGYIAYGMADTGNANDASAVTVWFHHDGFWAGHGDQKAYIALSTNGGSSYGTPAEIDLSTTGGQWLSETFAGTYTQSQINDLVVKFIADSDPADPMGAGSNNGYTLNQFYVEAVYPADSNDWSLYLDPNGYGWEGGNSMTGGDGNLFFSAVKKGTRYNSAPSGSSYVTYDNTGGLSTGYGREAMVLTNTGVTGDAKAVNVWMYGDALTTATTFKVSVSTDYVVGNDPVTTGTWASDITIDPDNQWDSATFTDTFTQAELNSMSVRFLTQFPTVVNVALDGFTIGRDLTYDPVDARWEQGDATNGMWMTIQDVLGSTRVTLYAWDNSGTDTYLHENFEISASGGVATFYPEYGTVTTEGNGENWSSPSWLSGYPMVDDSYNILDPLDGFWNANVEQVYVEAIYDDTIHSDEDGPIGGGGGETITTSSTNLTAIYDRSGQANHGTPISFNSTSTSVGKIGQALAFDGVSNYISVGNTVSGVKSVAFWIKAESTTQMIIDLNGTQSIEVSGGTVAANNFTSPIIYVDGAVSSALSANKWQHVVVTTGSSFNASAITIGKIASGYLAGSLDDVRIYNKMLTATEAATLFRGTVVTINASQNDKQTSGLVGLWSFDGKDTVWTSSTAGTVYDRSPTINTGTLTNMNQVTSPAIGKIGQAFNLRSTNDYINIPNNSAINFGANADFTVAIWVKTTQNGLGTGYTVVPVILGKDDSAATRSGYNIMLRNDYVTTYGWYFEILNTSGTTFRAGNTASISDGKWHLLVGMRSGSSIAVYQDGQFIQSQSGTTASLQKNIPLRIGYYNNAVHNYNGYVDDLRIYDRALSADEVLQLYRTGK